MNDLPPVRLFRLSPDGIECDERGLRIGHIALLTRGERSGWAPRDGCDLDRDLSRLYGIRVEVEAKMAGLSIVAKALQNGNLAKAQIAALLLRLPEPLPLAAAELGKSGKRSLLRDLVACGLMKADAGWDEVEHPRAGSPPNPGWFATKPKEAQAEEAPNAAAKPNESASWSIGATRSDRAFVPPVVAVGATSLLAENLSTTALKALATLAGRMSAPAILFGAIFIPSANQLVDEGPVPGRPDMIYRWAHDQSRIEFRSQIDGHWWTLTSGVLDLSDGAFYGPSGDIVARIVLGPGRRPTLITIVDGLDRSLAQLRRPDGEPLASPTNHDDEPKLCPAPTPEPKTTKSKNSIAYQEYVSGLPYGLAIRIGDIDYDGCEHWTGNLLDGKADIDHLFDDNNVLYMGQT